MDMKEMLERKEAELELDMNKTQYIVIAIEDELIGINIKYIESILLRKGITRVPNSQKEFKGVINLRGEVVPMMSLRTKMGFEEKEFTNKTRFVILRMEDDELLGLITDEVKEVISLGDDEIDVLAYSEKKSNKDFGLGIGKSGKNLITILNVKNLIA